MTARAAAALPVTCCRIGLIVFHLAAESCRGCEQKAKIERASLCMDV
jgi:hypothetical protein